MWKISNFTKTGLVVVGMSIAGILPTSTHADLVQFGLRSNSGGTINGSTYELNVNGIIVNNVTFDATLSVTGDGNNVANDLGGLGVDGPSVETGESLAFTMSVSNVMGGNIIFEEFTSLGFNMFDAVDFDAVLFSSGDLVQDQTFNSYDLTTLTGGAPTNFSILGAGDISSFQMTNIVASFTGVPGPAVPEPTMAPIALAAGLMCFGRRRRKCLSRNPLSFGKD